MSPHLGHRTLEALAAESRPLLDPRELAPRVVHFGLGAFHRAHQAVYTEAASAATGEAIGIVAVAPRDASVVQRARRQDHLFSVTTRSPEGSGPRVVAALSGALHLRDDAVQVDSLISSAEVSTVTLTVTEKGYHRDPATGRLDLADPRIVADLALSSQADAAVQTVVGRLALSLANRLRTSGAPIDVVSCDNLDGNGAVLASVVRDFVTAADWADSDKVLAWLEHSVGFPATVVDRIVPATTQADLDEVAARLGVRDELAVSGEPYTQWVLQNDFRAARPAWEHGGAQLVDDVAPYQLTKLRLLNGAHSGLAYLGLAAGCRTIADVLATPWGAKFVRGYAADVAAALPAGGPDPVRYAESLVARFENPAIHHELRQIGSDGSLKLPQRWFTVLREQRGTTAGEHQTLALAAWANATRPDPSSGGQLFGTTDPAAPALADCWKASSVGVVSRLLTVLGAEDLAEDSALTGSVEALLPAFGAGAVLL
ncbi:mannitol dehydrogenase [Kineosporia sp. NBRC 101677]|uniref:mannitol dehydrogenase family protein n=1 Tax=Kineosporia sp. NBRC 101677 TaxID=3032197 RepID=UPI0024A42F66|nr:mannitol dehydrogenase family protein [Kineosporia sp. NBRC 101677]GLY18955.1 mannitol dehydrogenase [Kineosporia sp. NBRC 101677]